MKKGKMKQKICRKDGLSRADDDNVVAFFHKETMET